VQETFLRCRPINFQVNDFSKFPSYLRRTLFRQIIYKWEVKHHCVRAQPFKIWEWYFVNGGSSVGRQIETYSPANTSREDVSRINTN
jgi:hypothetical protein